MNEPIDYQGITKTNIVKIQSSNPDQIKVKGLVSNPLIVVGGKMVGEKSAVTFLFYYSYLTIGHHAKI